jgi:hypothetical protein
MSRRATPADPNNRGVIRRVRALETQMSEVRAEQTEQGKTLKALADSDTKRTAHEGTIYFMVTKGIPAVIALATAGAWLISHYR